MGDQREIDNQGTMLAQYRRTLAHLLTQAAQYGGEVFVPPQTANGIAQARAEIQRMKAALRADGVAVEDEPNDAESPRVEPLPSQRAVGDSIGGDKIAGDKVGGDKVMGDQTTISTGGGNYIDSGGGDVAGRDIDKRQGGPFVEESVIVGDVVHQQTINYYQPATTPLDRQQQRNRRAMLTKVKTIWIKGLLEQSLAKELRIALDLTEQPDAVDLPLNALVQELNRPARELPAGTPIIQVFEQMGGALLILGAPGAGKTTLLLELARDLIARAEQDEGHSIPVVFNLSSWAANRRPLEAWLAEELNRLYDVPRKIAQAWVDTDMLLPLLDGLDEVAADYREACVEAINAYQEEHGLVPLTVCSRVTDYKALITKLQLQGAVLALPLTPQQIDAYFQSVGDQLAALRMALVGDAALRELAESPMMLSIMTLAYQGQPAGSFPERGATENQQKHLFAIYIERMFERRGAKMPYRQKQMVDWLTGLARGMTRQSQSIFLIERLQPEWLPSKAARWQYCLLDRLGSGCGMGLCIAFIGTLGSELLSLIIHYWFDRPSTLNAVLLLRIGISYGVFGALVAGVFGRNDERLLRLRRHSLRVMVQALLGGLVISVGVQIVSVMIWAAILSLINDSTHNLRTVIFDGFQIALQSLQYPIYFLRSALIGALIGALTTLPSVRLRRIVIVETVRWSWLKARWAMLAGGGIGFIAGPLFSVADQMSLWQVLNPQHDWVLISSWVFYRVLHPGLFYGVVLAVILSIIMGIFGGLATSELDNHIHPNQGIRRSLRRAIRLSIVCATGSLLLGIVGWVPLLFGISQLNFSRAIVIIITNPIGSIGGFAFGGPADISVLPLIFGGWDGLVTFGVIGGLAYGGYAVLSHLALRLVLSRNGVLPFRLVPFLDECAERIFLRKVGGGYIFVHRLLMEHFASLHEAPPTEHTG